MAGDKKGDKKEGQDAPEKPFELLEQDFLEMLQELSEDKNLERFRIEYEKLYRLLGKCTENENRLAKKCRELNTEIAENSSKIEAAIHLSEVDQQTIETLKEEIEKAWKTVDSSRDKEVAAKETIQQLKVDVANLQHIIEQGTIPTVDEEETLNELMKQKDELVKERDQQVDTILSLRTELMQIQEKFRTVDNERNTLELDIAALRKQASSKKAEADKEQRKKERMEKEIQEIKVTLEEKQSDLRQKQAEIEAGDEHTVHLEHMVKDARAAFDKAQKDLNGMTEKLQRVQRELEDRLQANTQISLENNRKQMQIKTRDDEIAELKKDIIRINKLRDQSQKKAKQFEEERIEVEKEKETLEHVTRQLERDVATAKNEVADGKRQIEELTREQEILTKMRSRAENATTKQHDLVKVNENACRNLENEIRGYKAEAQNQFITIRQLEKERERYSGEMAEASKKYVQALEELKIREMSIVEYRKRIEDSESKLKQQQNLYETVRADRNLYSKNLIEAQDEIHEMRRKFKIMDHQVDQLKQEISSKDLFLVKEHFDHMKVVKEKDALRTELVKAKGQMTEAEKAVTTQLADIEKLNHIIAEADQERARQCKEYDIVINERDILGTQLIRRNDELVLLYEKIKIQASTLSKGHMQYKERTNEIRILRIKLGDYRRELHLLKGRVENVDVLQKEVHSLAKELIHQQVKVKALTEELETPMNVHRWRKLEGSDPTAYEMVQKIQTLQKRLIAKTEEVLEKDLAIKDMEKEYVELQATLARHPGPEVTEQLYIYQANLREKAKQMKSMASELNMYQAQVQEYKYDMEKLTMELTNMKKKYFESKRREAKERERQPQPAEDNIGVKMHYPAQQMFTGGGFSLSSPTPA